MPLTHSPSCLASLEHYLQSYARQDLAAVSDLLADDVHLRDWKISVLGKQAAIEETRKNFAAARSITIDLLHHYEMAHGIAAELRIVVDAVDVLYVVDVVHFNAQGQIQSIRAYLGRGD